MALPRQTRPHVHALYGFCRYVDDIVDSVPPGSPESLVRRQRLAALARRVTADLDARTSNHPVLAAVVDTAVRYRIPPSCFDRFLRSMAMDLDVRRYQTFDDLRAYTDGSAMVIGEMMLPLLGAGDEAREPARALGEAFQLTNFLRDVGEDLGRGRVYLPWADVESFGAADALALRAVTPEFVALMRFEIARCRQLYEAADGGIDLLPPASARAIRAARLLYARILDRIEENGYDVFSRRARVSSATKFRVVALQLGHAVGRVAT